MLKKDQKALEAWAAWSDRDARSVPHRLRDARRPYDYDVVIVGAGTAGFLTALALSRKSDLRIAIVDQPQALVFDTSEQLGSAACEVLDRLQLWRPFLVEHHVRAMSRRSRFSDRLTNTYIYDPEQSGWTVERYWFDDLLLREVQGRHIIVEPSLVLLDYDEQRGILVRRADGATIYVSAAFVVDASGPRSAYARLRGAKRQVVDHLAASTVTFERPLMPSQPADTEAWSQGWWFADHRPHGQMLVSCMTDPEAVEPLGLTALDRWWAQLDRTDQIRRRIADAWASSTPVVHSASCENLDPFAGPDWLAVDDAALCVPPMGRPGVGRAIVEADRAAASVRAYLEGQDSALVRYADDLEAERSKFAAVLTDYYAQERDPWSDKTFWRRRDILAEPGVQKGRGRRSRLR